MHNLDVAHKPLARGYFRCKRACGSMSTSSVLSPGGLLKTGSWYRLDGMESIGRGLVVAVELQNTTNSC